MTDSAEPKTKGRPSADDAATLASRIIWARSQLGIEQAEVRARARLSTGQMTRLENGERGKRASSQLIDALARALKVHPEWLATGKHPEGLVWLDDKPRNQLTEAHELALKVIALREELDAARAQVADLKEKLRKYETGQRPGRLRAVSPSKAPKAP